MPERIPQGIVLRVPLKAYLSSDHISDATGLSDLAVTISKNGLGFSNPSAGVVNATAIGNGWYYVDLSTTDTETLGPLIVRAKAATSDASEIAYNVVLATNGGLTALPNTVVATNASLLTSGTGAAQLSVASGAVILTTAERDSVADAMLDRNMGTGTDSGTSTIRTVRQALRFLRNKWSVVGTTLTVYKEDDTMASWTATLTTDAAATPVTASDPAS